MIPVYICEDEPQQLKILKKIVTQTIKKEKIEGMKLVCATTSPAEILEKVNSDDAPLYFLDIELGENSMSGLELATKIRSRNSTARIVMVTAYNFALETYQMKIGVQDYVMKGSISAVEDKIKECLIEAISSPQNRTNDDRAYIELQNEKIAINDIISIEITANMPRKLTISKTNGVSRLSGTLKEVKCQADKVFLYCHKSCLVNINYVKEISTATNEVIMVDGVKKAVSWRYIKSLKISVQSKEF